MESFYTNPKGRERKPVKYWSRAEKQPSVTYASASSITIGPGCLRDDSNRDWIEWANTLAVSLASSGLLGLDAGSEASNTWYYPWIIGRSNGAVSAILSTSSSNPTLPRGYHFKRRIDIAIRNDNSSNIIPFVKSGNIIQYRDFNNDDYRAINGGATSGGAWSGAISLTGLVPPESNRAILTGHVFNDGTASSGDCFIRAAGATHNGTYVGVSVAGGSIPTFATHLDLLATKELEYRTGTANARLVVSVQGFYFGN